MDLLTIYGDARENAFYWKTQWCISEEVLATYYSLWWEAEEMASKAYAMLNQ